jgi:GntP family gluconate:H+ symporter
MNPQDWKLILLALIAITALIVLITKAKVNAFLSLLMASLVVGLGAVLLLDVPIRDTTGKVLTSPEGKTAAYTVLGVMKSFGDGLGATLAGTAGVIALGTMLGKLLWSVDSPSL